MCFSSWKSKSINREYQTPRDIHLVELALPWIRCAILLRGRIKRTASQPSCTDRRARSDPQQPGVYLKTYVMVLHSSSSQRTCWDTTERRVWNCTASPRCSNDTITHEAEPQKENYCFKTPDFATTVDTSHAAPNYSKGQTATCRETWRTVQYILNFVEHVALVLRDYSQANTSVRYSEDMSNISMLTCSLWQGYRADIKEV